MSGYRPGPDDGRAWQDRPQPWRDTTPQPPPGPVQPYPQPSPPQQQYQPYPQPYPPRPVVVVPVKTPGLAVLFSFLWLGAGNCYAGQTALGVCLIVTQVVCAPIATFLASVTFGLSLVVTGPIWLVAFVVSAVTGYNACKEHNRTLGLPYW